MSILTILAHISWTFGVELVKSSFKLIGLSPVKPSVEFLWRVTLIFWSWNIALDAISLSLISFKTELENTDNPSWFNASESSQTEYNVLLSSIKVSEISLAPTVISILSLSLPFWVLEILSQPFSVVIFIQTSSYKGSL